jgi:hypothetical protein
VAANSCRKFIPTKKMQKMLNPLDSELRSINIGGRWFKVGESGRIEVEFKWQVFEENMNMRSTRKEE